MAVQLRPTCPGRCQQQDRIDALLAMTRWCIQLPVTSVEVAANSSLLFQLPSGLTMLCMAGVCQRHVYHVMNVFTW